MAHPPLDDDYLASVVRPASELARTPGAHSRSRHDLCSMQCELEFKLENKRICGFEPIAQCPICREGIAYAREDRARVATPFFATGDHTKSFSPNDAIDQIAMQLGRFAPNEIAVIAEPSRRFGFPDDILLFCRDVIGTPHCAFVGEPIPSLLQAIFGCDLSPASLDDLTDADLIIAVGLDPAQRSPTSITPIWQARDRGAKLCVIESEATSFSRTADHVLHIPSEKVGNFALQTLRSLVDQDKVDRVTISKRIVDSELFLDHICEAGSDRSDDAIALARLLADAQKPMWIVDRSIMTWNEIVYLFALIVASSPRAHLAAPVVVLCSQGAQAPLHRLLATTPFQYQSSTSVLNKVQSGEIRAVLYFGHDPPVRIAQSLAATPFLGVLSHRPHALVRCADWVLPTPSREEQSGAIVLDDGSIRPLYQVMIPADGTLDEVSWMQRLAKALDRPFVVDHSLKIATPKMPYRLRMGGP